MEPLVLLLVTLPMFSPLLTLAWLWQLKEWRIDRMKEHLHREGWMSQLFGRVRPTILGLYLFGLVLFVFLGKGARTNGIILLAGYWILGTIILLLGITAFQLFSRRQRLPRWTSKAIAMVSVTLTLTVITAWVFLAFPITTPLLPLLSILQPVLMFMAWVILLPLDFVLKQRVLKRAMVLRARYNITAVGITGSVGKTTTKELLAHLLQSRHPLVTPSYVNTEMGIAQWLLRELPKHDPSTPLILIAEMGAYRKGEIALLSSIVQQTYGICTFIGTQHLALFGSQQKLMEAKGELLQALPAHGRAFLNADSEPCREMKQFCSCPVTMVGTGAESTLKAERVQETAQGLIFDLQGMSYATPLHGVHNITNVLLAMAAAETLGVPREEIRTALTTFKAPSTTFSVRTERGVRILDDTHNASVSSLLAAIAWAKTQPEQQKLLITSGIIELGMIEDETHRQIGHKAADVFADAVVLTPSLAHSFEEGFGKTLLTASDLQQVEPGSLLVCVGRMPQSLIRALLPSA